ncbi:hypothetical protein HYH03_017050 [Edaphochlamys debaryana]|uniref:Uncharacterized protein n=1 Tax=Edaphochlamys debaryana TaxID=47281 RepID=A0A835XHC3_9CHLO|nr:hypothetical protein HYH03_017050 [Edaphochlamys debaryana]|eukprot:KAG2484098.1 hypothetical protein HYH03_017050 [Edaphochlamys debaryana]
MERTQEQSKFHMELRSSTSSLGKAQGSLPAQTPRGTVLGPVRTAAKSVGLRTDSRVRVFNTDMVRMERYVDGLQLDNQHMRASNERLSKYNSELSLLNASLRSRIKTLEDARMKDRHLKSEYGAYQNVLMRNVSSADTTERSLRERLEVAERSAEFFATQYGVRAGLSAVTLMPDCDQDTAQQYARVSVGLPSDRLLKCTNGGEYGFPDAKYVMEGATARLATTMINSPSAHFAIIAMNHQDYKLPAKPPLMSAIDKGVAMSFRMIEEYRKLSTGKKVELAEPCLMTSPFANPENQPKDHADGASAPLVRPGSGGSEAANNQPSSEAGGSGPCLPPKKRKPAYPRAHWEESARKSAERHVEAAAAAAAVIALIADETDGSDMEVVE